MPRRVKASKEDPDEPHHLVVVNAYPGRCTLDTDTDKIGTSRWIACTIGKDQLLALFHRPGAENEIIIEVKKSCRSLDRLLGAHDWAKFLKNVPEKDQRNVSKVFFCRLKSGTEVEGAGWKRVFVQERWFKDWNPANDIFTYPYPKSYRCEVPVGTNPVHVPLALNLPVAHFPVLPPVPSPPVGSPAWIANRGARFSSAVNANKPTNAWGKSGPIAMPTPSRPTGAPSAWGSAPTPKAHTVPGKPWGARSTTILTSAGFPAPSGLALRAEAFLPPPGLSRTPANSSPALSASITSSDDDNTGWWSPDVGSTGTASTGPPVAVAEPGRFEQAMASLALDAALGHEDADEDALDADMEMAVYASVAPQGQVIDSLWDADEDAAPAADRDQLVCEVHGTRCSTGICKAYGAQRAEQRWREREAAEKRGRRGKDRTRAHPQWAREDEGEGRRRNTRARDVQPKIDPRARPSHLQAGDQAKPSHLANEVRGKPPHLGESRAKPAHLQKAASGGQPGAAISPVQGEHADSDGGWQKVSRSSAANKTGWNADEDEAGSVALSEPGDWENVSEGPWNAPNAWGKRAAAGPASEPDDWENVSEGPWNVKAPRLSSGNSATSQGKASKVTHRWSEYPLDEDYFNQDGALSIF